MRVRGILLPARACLPASNQWSHVDWLEQSIPIVFMAYMRFMSDILFSKLMRAGSVWGENMVALLDALASGRSHSEEIKKESGSGIILNGTLGRFLKMAKSFGLHRHHAECLDLH